VGYLNSGGWKFFAAPKMVGKKKERNLGKDEFPDGIDL